MSLFAILPAIIFVSAFNVSGQNENEILIVADRGMPTATRPTTSCLAVKRLSEEKFSPLCQNIENFNYLSGYFYVLEARLVNENMSGKKYRLRKILAQVKSENVSTPNSPAVGLFGTEWKLTKINGVNVGESKAFIVFNEQKNSVGGNGGCNVFGGQMVKNGEKIKLSQIFSTKMFCAQGSEIENKFLGNLERATEYSISANRLILKSGKVILLEFEPRNGN